MRKVLPGTIAVILLAACAEPPTAHVSEVGLPAAQFSQQGPFVHRVTAGGPDICLLFELHPGCDGNLSLIVLELADGSLTGQGQDSFGGHLSIDCLEVEGSSAWIGGEDRFGARWILKVVDAGQNATDPPDSASRRLFGGTDPTLCHRKPGGGVRATTTPVPQGQVRVE
jgi:hypothetical protein